MHTSALSALCTYGGSDAYLQPLRIESGSTTRWFSSTAITITRRSYGYQPDPVRISTGSPQLYASSSGQYQEWYRVSTTKVVNSPTITALSHLAAQRSLQNSTKHGIGSVPLRVVNSQTSTVLNSSRWHK